MKTIQSVLSKGCGKKQLILFALLVSAGFTEVMAQTVYRSKTGTGNWENTTTWDYFNGTSFVSLPVGGTIPSQTSGSITITSGSTVTINVNRGADELTVENGGTLEVASSKMLVIYDGAGTDLSVNGILIAKGQPNDSNGNIAKHATGTPTIAFSATGVYKHNYVAFSGKTYWGIIPIASWNPASTIEIYVAGTTLNSTSIPGTANLTQNFGNVKWDTPNLGGVTIAMNSLLTNIQGNFEIASTGISTLVLTPSTSNSYSLTIGKNFMVKGSSTVVFADGNSTTPAAAFNLNIGGNFEIDGGVDFTHIRKSFPVNVNFTGSGSINTGVTISDLNFTIALGGNMTLLSNLTLNSGQTLNVLGRLNTAAFRVNGGGNFNLQNGGSLSLGHAAGLSTTSGNIRTSGTNVFSKSATYLFEGTSAQETGNALPDTVANLMINNAKGVSLTNSASINTELYLENGVLNTHSNSITINNGGITTRSEKPGFINGALSFNVTSNGTKNIFFPTGNGSEYRPVILEFTQNNQDAGTPSIYTVQQVEGKPTKRNLPAGNTVDRVSSVRYYIISKTGDPTSTITNGKVKLAYGTSDLVTDPMNLSIVKSNGSPDWEDLGGAPFTIDGVSGVASEFDFTTFSDFVLANATGGSNPLPVELISLNAKKVKETVELTWKTATEKNNDFFAIERSADGTDFTLIASLKSAGTTSSVQVYTHSDENPLPGISYYRLAQTDLDGSVSFSQIVKVNFANQANIGQVVTYPNPAISDMQVKVHNIAGEANLEIYDLTGKLMLSRKITAAEKPTLHIASFPTGLYTIRVQSANETAISRFLKQ
jgi:hypothetical protein